MIQAVVISQRHTITLDTETSTLLTQLTIQTPQKPTQKPCSLHLTFNNCSHNLRLLSPTHTLSTSQTNINYGSTPFSLQTFLELFKENSVECQFWPNGKTLNNGKRNNLRVLGVLINQTKINVQQPFELPIGVKGKRKREIVVMKKLDDERLVVVGGRRVSQEVQEGDWKVECYEMQGDITDSCLYFPKAMKITQYSPNLRIITALNTDPTYLPSLLSSTLPSLPFPIDPALTLIVTSCTNFQLRQNLAFYNPNASLQSLQQLLTRHYLRAYVEQPWLLYGMAGYSQNEYRMEALRRRFLEIVEDGEEMFPLSDGSYHWEQGWRVKAVVVYAMFVNLTQTRNLTQTLLELLGQRKLTTQLFEQLLTTCFSACNIHSYLQQFTLCTGVPELSLELLRNQKQKSLQIQIQQRPLQSQHFKRQNSVRVILQWKHGVCSPLTSRILQKNKLKLEEKIPEDLEFDGELVREFAEDMDGALAVPVLLRSSASFRSEFRLQFQTNSSSLTPNRYFTLTRNTPTSTKSYTIFPQPFFKATSKELHVAIDSDNHFLFLQRSNRGFQVGLERWILDENPAKRRRGMLEIQRRLGEGDEEVVRWLVEVLGSVGNGRVNGWVRAEIYGVLGRMKKVNRMVLRCLIQQLLCCQSPHTQQQYHHMRISLLNSLSHLTPTPSPQFQHLHLLLLSLSKNSPQLHSHPCQLQFRVALYQVLLKWHTRISLYVVEEVFDVLKMGEVDWKRYGPVVEVIVQRLQSYLDGIQGTEQFRSFNFNNRCGEIRKYLQKIVESNPDLWNANFKYNIQKHLKSPSFQPLQFLTWLFNSITLSQQCNPLQTYLRSLKTLHQTLKSHRQLLALAPQFHSPLNQNCYIAYTLWSNLTSEETLRNAQVRVWWMRIYKLFYFYYTPVCVIRKIKQAVVDVPRGVFEIKLGRKEKQEVMELVRDFLADLAWMCGFSSKFLELPQQEQQVTIPANTAPQKPCKPPQPTTTTNPFLLYLQQHPKSPWQSLCRKAVNLYLQRLTKRKCPYQVCTMLRHHTSRLFKGNFGEQADNFEDFRVTFMALLKDMNLEDESMGKYFQRIGEVLQGRRARGEESKEMEEMEEEEEREVGEESKQEDIHEEEESRQEQSQRSDSRSELSSISRQSKSSRNSYSSQNPPKPARRSRRRRRRNSKYSV